MSHLKSYEQFLGDWSKLKQTILRLNEELATLYDEIWVLVGKEMDLPYWCPEYLGDEPSEYLCPSSFAWAIYEEMFWRRERRTQHFIGGCLIQPVSSDGKTSFYLSWFGKNLARSPREEFLKTLQRLFNHLTEDEGYGKKVNDFLDRQEQTYYKDLEKVKQDIRDIIKAIELGNIIKGKCKYCT